MRAPLVFCLLLSYALSAQLTFQPGSLDLGQVPVGTRRLLTVRLHNGGVAPVLVEAVMPMDVSLSLPVPPVTGPARWLAGMDSVVIPVAISPRESGSLLAELQTRSSTESVSTTILADGVSVFISEVLADPGAGAAGDANGDEFVELRDGGLQTIDLGGWRLGDDDAATADWFVFPPTTVAPGGFIVLFGGGTPTAIEAAAFVDDGRIGDGLANGGDMVILMTASGDTASTMQGSNWGNNRSVARDTGDDLFLPHDGTEGVAELFSPGRSARVEPVEVVTPAGRATAQVLIVEVLADPPSGPAGDSNGDGVRETYGDEFIELLNRTEADVDIGGWSLSDDDTSDRARFHFPEGVRLAAGGRVVLFGGGGAPTEISAFTDDGRIGNGLTNGGDVVILRNAAGDTVDAVDGTGWTADRSSVRTPETCLADCDWRPYDGGSSAAAFSPGVAAAVQDTSRSSPLPANTTVRISEILPSPPAVGVIPTTTAGSTATKTSSSSCTMPARIPSICRAGNCPMTTPRRIDDSPFPRARTCHRVPAVDDLIFVDDGRIGNGLTNAGDRVLLVDALGRTASDVSFGTITKAGQSPGQSLEISVSREPHPHGELPGGFPFSPGLARPVYTSFAADSLIITLGRPPPAPVLRAMTPTEGEEVDANSVRWLALHEDILRFEENRPLAVRAGNTVVEAWLRGSVVARAPGVVRQPSPTNTAPRFVSTPPSRGWVQGRFRYDPLVVDEEGKTLAYARSFCPTAYTWAVMTASSWDGHHPNRGTSRWRFRSPTDRAVWQHRPSLWKSVIEPLLRIAEVLADPPPGTAGDANGDGLRQTWADEFVELVNDGTESITLDRWQLTDASGRQTFTFAPGTRLDAGGRLVVFGSDAGGRLGNGLDNRRDAVVIVDPAGPETLAVARFGLRSQPTRVHHLVGRRNCAAAPLPMARASTPLSWPATPPGGLHSPCSSSCPTAAGFLGDIAANRELQRRGVSAPGPTPLARRIMAARGSCHPHHRRYDHRCLAGA